MPGGNDANSGATRAQAECNGSLRMDAVGQRAGNGEGLTRPRSLPRFGNGIGGPAGWEPALFRLGGARQRVEEGLEQVGEGGAVTGGDEGFRRHPRDERLAAEAGELGLGNADLRLVVGRAGDLVDQPVG